MQLALQHRCIRLSAQPMGLGAGVRPLEDRAIISHTVCRDWWAQGWGPPTRGEDWDPLQLSAQFHGTWVCYQSSDEQANRLEKGFPKASLCQCYDSRTNLPN